MSKTVQVDEQGFVFRMEEGEGDLPLAGVFWTHVVASQDFTQTDKIDEEDVPSGVVSAPFPVLEETPVPSELPPVNLDFEAIRQLVPPGTPLKTLLDGLRADLPPLEPISPQHWVHRVFNETYFRARPPVIGKRRS